MAVCFTAVEIWQQHRERRHTLPACSWAAACSTNMSRLCNNTRWWPLTSNPTDSDLRPHRQVLRNIQLSSCCGRPSVSLPPVCLHCFWSPDETSDKRVNMIQRQTIELQKILKMCLCLCLAARVKNIWRECVSFEPPLHRRGQKVTISFRVTAVMVRGAIFKSRWEEQPSLMCGCHTSSFHAKYWNRPFC